MAVQSTTVERKIADRPPANLWRDAFERLLKNRLAIVGGIIVLLLVLLAVVGPFITPYGYDETNTRIVRENRGPANPGQGGHLLGTDILGRDLLSRIMDGARISMTVALVVQVTVLVIGVPIGALAGWFGGRVDNLLMRFTDITYAFPDLLFIILLTVVFKDTWFGNAVDGLLLVFVAIGIVSWVGVARLVRGQMLSLKETEYVEAARAIGVPDRKIVTRHLLPNSIGPIIVAVTLGIPGAILAESLLAFIGIGANPPRASWGTLITDGQRWMSSEPHLLLYPAIAIALALLSFTFLGDGLRDALDPKLKGKQ
ncbi:MAG TPA: ABC transporter permease [Candidatus Limnocylindria bacterium]|nr:ABC transporter permease [Candidatus Limnocylindria bacterium]